MKKLVTITPLIVVICSGIFFGSRFENSSPQPETKITIAVPTYALDLSDLDARDSLNRPINSVAMRKKFENLFSSRLNELLMEGLTPLRRSYLEFLSRFSSACPTWFQAFTFCVHKIVGVLFDARRVRTIDSTIATRSPVCALKNSAKLQALANSLSSLRSTFLSSTVLLR